jgi:hypothetical protein
MPETAQRSSNKKLMFQRCHLLGTMQAMLQQCVVNGGGAKPEADGIEPTRLFPTRSQSDQLNQRQLKALKAGDPSHFLQLVHRFSILFSVLITSATADQLAMKPCPSPLPQPGWSMGFCNCKTLAVAVLPSVRIV